MRCHSIFIFAQPPEISQPLFFEGGNLVMIEEDDWTCEKDKEAVNKDTEAKKRLIASTVWL